MKSYDLFARKTCECKRLTRLTLIKPDDYRTGMRCETTAHLSKFPQRLADAIIRKVG